MRADPPRSAWAVDPLPELPPTELAVDWPSGGLDPFDLSERGSQRLHLVGSRPCRGFVTRDPFPDERGADDAVPRQRARLALVEKLAVARDGAILAEWPRERARPDGPFAGQTEGATGSLRLAIRAQRTAMPWLAREPRLLDRVRAGEPDVRGNPAGPLTLDDLGDDYAAALDLLLGLSAALGDEPAMLTHQVAACDWF